MDSNYEIKVFNLGDNLQKVRNNLKQINPQDADINILAGQPGTGKTTWWVWYNNIQESIHNIGIATQRHNNIDEWKINGLNHWEGLKRKCPKSDKIKWMLEQHLHADIICRLMKCNKEDCPYRQQFDNKNRVGLPLFYLHTQYINDFQILAVEESILGYDSFQYDIEKLIEGILALDYSEPNEYINDFKAVASKDWYYLYDNIDRLEFLKKNSLYKAAKHKDSKLIKEILKLDINGIRMWLHSKRIYQEDFYHYPHIFKIFDLAQNKPIVLLNAGFHENTFRRLLDRYYREYPATKYLKIKIYTSDIQNKNTKLYKITKSAFSESGIYNNELINKFLKVLPKDIGIITYQKYAKGLQHSFDTQYFGNTSGLNKFENKQILVIIGTPNIGLKDRVKAHNALFHDNLDLSKFQNIVDEQIDKGRYPKFVGTQLQDITAAIEINSQYDNIHRNRGLIHDKEIYLLGLKPLKLNNEFTIIDIKHQDVERFLDRISDKKFLAEDKMIRQIQEYHNKGMSPVEIAKSLDIRMKGSTKYDTDAVKGFLRLRKIYASKTL